MKIVTWNCCLPPWSATRRKRLPKIISSIVSFNADVVLLQEVFFESDKKKIILELKSFGYQYSICIRDLLFLSKQPIIDSQQRTFCEQGSIFSWSILDRMYGKAFQLVKIKTKQFGELVIGNTHLLSALAVQKDNFQSVRKKQVEEIITLSDSRFGSTSIILAGDFNFKLKTVPYRAVINLGFSDSTDGLNLITHQDYQLDYFFTKNFNHSSKIETISLPKISDHSVLSITF